MIQVLADEAGVHPGNVEDRLSLGVERREGRAHVDVQPHDHRQHQSRQYGGDDTDDLQRARARGATRTPV